MSELAAEAANVLRTEVGPSRSSVCRWLMHDALRPWCHHCWIFPRDPHFLELAGPVLDLYACRWQGKPLWADDYVLSADEKTSIQARRRLQPTLPPGPHQAARVEHEYERQGALQYLAAWDVHRAVVFGRCEPKTGKAAFGRLVDQVMDQEPYRSARRASWLNQIEISSRPKVLKPNDSTSLEELVQALQPSAHATPPSAGHLPGASLGKTSNDVCVSLCTSPTR